MQHEDLTPADPDKRTRRWEEQRWLVDSLIAAHGPEVDQPRSLIYSAPAGFEALAEFQGINPRIRKFADMHREYAAAGGEGARVPRAGAACRGTRVVLHRRAALGLRAVAAVRGR